MGQGKICGGWQRVGYGAGCACAAPRNLSVPRPTFSLPFAVRARYNTRTIVMKKLFCSLLLAIAVASTVQADIQDPPVADQGPTRKFGRGLSNLLSGVTEIPNNIAMTGDTDGPESLAYHTIRGIGRAFIRGGVGFYEMITAPFPTNKGKYTPILRSNVQWIHGGYEEFPPELGWESRYNYAR